MDERTCRIEGCGKSVAYRGWCRNHYERWRRNGDPLAGRVSPGNQGCSVSGCEKRYEARGYCVDHYVRWKKYGDPSGGRIVDDDDARFRSKYVVADNGCHEWRASIGPKGYGSFYAEARMWGAHLWAWIQVNGPVPYGLELDHFRYPQGGCLGPSCVNPEHVRPVTHRENVLRSNGFASAHAAKTHCKNGHPFDEGNTVVRAGNRHCRACAVAWREAHPDYQKEWQRRRRDVTATSSDEDGLRD